MAPKDFIDELMERYISNLEISQSFQHPAVTSQPPPPCPTRPPPSPPKQAASPSQLPGTGEYSPADPLQNPQVTMSETNGTTVPANDAATTQAGEETMSKGKGKAIETQDHTINQDEDSSEEESANEAAVDEPEEEDEDNMEEIDTSNIIGGGRRTRGKAIDFAEAERKAKEAGDNLDEEDEDEDEDFEEARDEDEEMKD